MSAQFVLRAAAKTSTSTNFPAELKIKLRKVPAGMQDWALKLGSMSLRVTPEPFYGHLCEDASGSKRLGFTQAEEVDKIL